MIILYITYLKRENVILKIIKRWIFCVCVCVGGGRVRTRAHTNTSCVI